MKARGLRGWLRIRMLALLVVAGAGQTTPALAQALTPRPAVVARGILFPVSAARSSAWTSGVHRAGSAAVRGAVTRALRGIPIGR